MKKIDDQDLILLYYGEHEDPELPRIVASSTEFSERFESLTRLLALADHYQPEADGELSSRLWQSVSPHLHPVADTSADKSPKAGALWQALIRPRWSMAGALSLVLVAVLAFWMGSRNGYPPPGYEETAGFTPERLFQAGLVHHLERSERLLVEVSNGSFRTPPQEVSDLLLSNRVYRQRAEAGGQRRIAALLEDLETVLLEMSNSPPHSRQQRESQRLLFNVRVTQNSLEHPEISL